LPLKRKAYRDERYAREEQPLPIEGVLLQKSLELPPHRVFEIGILVEHFASFFRFAFGVVMLDPLLSHVDISLEHVMPLDGDELESDEVEEQSNRR
jgi:hypothetical protein